MLRELRDKDKYRMLEWMKDPVIMENFRFSSENATVESVQKFIDNANRNIQEKMEYHYAIINKADDYVGTVSLKNVDWQALSAEYAICIRRKDQGQGYGFTATKNILKIGFEELGLNRIYLNVIKDNEPAKRLYNKMGFKFEGEFRQHISIRGKIHSLEWYSMLAGEYKELYIDQ